MYTTVLVQCCAPLQDFTAVSNPEEMVPSHGVGDKGGGGWDEEEVLAADDGSDMEGWEDDGWGNFGGGSKHDPLAPPAPSSGADFFDTFQGGISSKTKERDYFTNFDSMTSPSSLSAKREKSPPPPVSAALFGGEIKTGNGSDGWGDWGADFGSTKPQVRNIE